MTPNHPTPTRGAPPLLPIRVERARYRTRYLAVLELDADECENVAHALGMSDAGSRQLLATAQRMREMAEDAGDERP